MKTFVAFGSKLRLYCCAMASCAAASDGASVVYDGLVPESCPGKRNPDCSGGRGAVVGRIEWCGRDFGRNTLVEDFLGPASGLRKGLARPNSMSEFGLSSLDRLVALGEEDCILADMLAKGTRDRSCFCGDRCCPDDVRPGLRSWTISHVSYCAWSSNHSDKRSRSGKSGFRGDARVLTGLNARRRLGEMFVSALLLTLATTRRVHLRGGDTHSFKLVVQLRRYRHRRSFVEVFTVTGSPLP